jgi:hypothetical protein
MGGVNVVPPSYTITDTPPLTGTPSLVDSELIDVDSARESAHSAIIGGINWSTMTKGTSSSSSRIDYNTSGTIVLIIRDVWSRYKWSVPNTFEGVFFRITWDVLEEPDGWDDPSPTVFRSFFEEDLTWEWTGPGDPENPDSWLSDWYEIPPPDVPGSRRVVNIRFECWTSTKIGSKPQVTGEAVEL